MFEKPSVADLREAAQKLGMTPSDAYLAAVEEIVTPIANAYATLDKTPDELPVVKYPRGEFHLPAAAENPHGAWYVKTAIKGKARGKLAGRRVALKDNICLAGVPMMIGAQLFDGYAPEIDATVVERVLDAGGEIAGKAVCEYFCVSGGSHTSASGPVHNPRKRGFSAGGSSSGCAALVAAGEVDMAIGGDQAGSIRIPASHCGIVGLKPSFGLVPYTGIALLEITIDTCGPMTANVADNALLLEVIAGPDGLDTRQRGVPVGRYTEPLAGGVKGMRIAVVKEGFGHPNSEADVDARVREAAQRFAKLGAVVTEVSVPTHALGFPVWAAIRGDAACIMLLEMNGAGIGHVRHESHGARDGLAQARRRIRRHTQDCLDFQPLHARSLRGPVLRQGAEPAPPRTRGLRRGVRGARPLAAADGADEGDTLTGQGCNAAGDHAQELGGNAQHLPVQRHGAPGNQSTMRHGRRPADRTDAGRPPLRRGDDLSRRSSLRALRRLDDILSISPRSLPSLPANGEGSRPNSPRA
jgi:Asp-tRNA(Asn)/Glu-tRNA(Gln) amidotransferase A subunit family amidase